VAAHPYRIEVTDLDSKRQVLLTVVDWDDTDRRAAIARSCAGSACSGTTASSMKSPLNRNLAKP